MTDHFNLQSTINEVMNDPVFAPYGRLLFPVNRNYMSGNTLGNLSLTWYSNIDPKMTVAIVNDLYNRAKAAETVFLNIYSDEEKGVDPTLKNTGLFFFKGTENTKTAICCAGGGFAYVGAMQDSFPHAYTLSRMGYNSFAVIYRPDARKACRDLARAIAFLFEHEKELRISMEGYSLWGGSAGARMAAWLGTYGTIMFGEQTYPKPGAVIMQYTGLSEVNGDEPPTYNCVGDADWIADDRVMARRIQRMKQNGTDAMIEVFPGLPHGFGLGTGTVAEGWLEHAVAFWERQVEV